MRFLKQPLIIGYIITGLVVSPYFLNIISSTEIIEIFSQLGVALLLFIVGLSLSPKVIKEVGKVSLVTGLGQIIFTALIGYFIAIALNFSIIESIYISVAFTFSSTIIIMKLLSDKKDLEKLYGKIAIGFLLVQDIVAAILLILISSSTKGAGIIPNLAFETLFKGILFLAILVLISLRILPRLGNYFAQSQELLFLFSIGWGLGFATLFHYFGFSIEIGALMAGVALSVSPYHFEISSKMRPLRDFFIILFFISLGSKMAFEHIAQFITPIIIFSLFIIIGNPLIFMILTSLLGYSKRVSFMSGISIAQISEFSLIMIALGVQVGHIPVEILSFAIMVGLITIAASTYLILYTDQIYSYLSPYLNIFELRNPKELKKEKKFKKYDIVLFGYNRVGYNFLKSFKKLKKKFLVVDYDPEMIRILTKEGVDCKYGDADDNEFLDDLDFRNVKMVVSTIPEFETNLLITRKIRNVNKKTIVILISHSIEEANILYEKGATYIVMPHFLGGNYASMMISKHGLNLSKFMQEKKKHIKHLKIRKKLGHEHPKLERHKKL